jgi:hypothetical protein
MRKGKDNFTFMQQSTPWGGKTNMLQPDYHVSHEPIGDVKKYGHLAFVTEDVCNKIMATGHGEMNAHIEYIKKRVGAIKKLRGCGKPKQTTMDF